MSTNNNLPQLPENPTPQDWGLPDNPSTVDRNTWRNQERFLAAYIACDGHPTIACRSAGIDYVTYRNWGISNKFNFSKRLELADAQVDDSLHAEIIRRGRDGVDHPIIYKGHVMGHYKQYSDNLLMFEYKARHPEYRDNYQVNVANDNRQVQVHHHYPEGPRFPDGIPSPGVLPQGEPYNKEADTEGQYRELGDEAPGN